MILFNIREHCSDSFFKNEIRCYREASRRIISKTLSWSVLRGLCINIPSILEKYTIILKHIKERNYALSGLQPDSPAARNH